MQLSADTVVAERFRLVRKLGQGGMGAVWLAQHLGLDIPCALKFCHAEAARSPELRGRFEREAKAAAQLRTPHVVNILDHGVWDDLPYIAMEYLEGEDLGQRLARVGALSPAETVAITMQVGRALTKANAVGLVHRDLKPGNIFLAKDDEREIAKVLDFGVAKVKEVGVDSSTKTGALLGTPYYMSPEQAKGSRDLDHRSDLWALAVVVFQCLTGRLPFPGQALGDLFVKIIAEPLPVPSQIAPVPAGFDAWWTRAASRNPDERFQTAKEFVDALALALGVTVLGGVEVGSAMANPGLMSSQSGAVAGGTPMPGALTPQPAALGTSTPAPLPTTPLPGGMTPAGPMGAATVPTPLQQSVSVVAPPRRRGGLFAGVIVAAAVVGSAGAFFVYRGSKDTGPKPAATAAPDTPAIAAPSAVASATPAVTDSAAPEAPRAAGTPQASADAPPPAASAGAAPAAVAPKKIGGAPPPAKPKKNCEPNYYLDAEGQKHFKPECFK